MKEVRTDRRPPGPPTIKRSKKIIEFNSASRTEYLTGFSKRKALRKTKGNLNHMKKEIQRKKDEMISYKQHVQTEYAKASEAVKHNYGAKGSSAAVAPAEEPVVSSATIVDDSTVFYPVEEEDPFGDVSIHISPIEPHQFVAMNTLLKRVAPLKTAEGAAAAETAATTPEKAVKAAEGVKAKAVVAGKSAKPTPTFAKFKKLTRSSQFMQKAKKQRKAAKTTLKKVKSTKKKSKR